MAKKLKKAWVVAVDMGYGHQRAAYPLKDIAFERIMTANSDKIISPEEKKLWKKTQAFYEGISRIRSIPVIGKFLWNTYDKLQYISPVYPFRDLSKPTSVVNYIARHIKKGLCSSLAAYIHRKQKMPLIATYFIPALSVEYCGIEDVWCVVTDTDVNRAWVAKDPKASKIKYLAPTENVVRRLREYGVPEERIFLTGFPLPKENLGGKNLKILKKDLGDRLPNLDPKRIYTSRYKEHIKRYLGKGNLKKKSSHPLTLTYAVGGAGAETEIGAKILYSLKKRILDGKIRVNLVAGIRLEVTEYFKKAVSDLGLKSELGKGVNIIFALDKKTYFSNFNQALHTTDILWTKPSELVFYTALGLPIIIAPPLGAHEHFNAKWLEQMGTGLLQEDPRYVNEWLFDWLNKGILAEAAWEGFMEAPKIGVYNIEKLVFGKRKK